MLQQQAIRIQDHGCGLMAVLPDQAPVAHFLQGPPCGCLDGITHSIVGVHLGHFDVADLAPASSSNQV